MLKITRGIFSEHAKKISGSCRHGRSAFTLIEILVVLAIIGVLAALLLAVGPGLRKAEKIRIAQAELAKVQAAIESYKARRDNYPPDNPGNPAINQLYFELKGVVLTNLNGQPTYITLDGSSRIAAADLPIVFGSNVNAILNYPNSGIPTDDEQSALQFLKELHPNQIGRLIIDPQPPVNALLLCSVRWSDDPALQVIPTAGNPRASQTGLNPWRYVSSNPTNNPHAYDLWVDLLIGGKTYRVNNWSKQPQVF